jgi:hypothetical protein
MFSEDIFRLRGQARQIDLLGHGAVFNAGPAACAPILSNITGTFADFYLEIARFAVDGFQVCVSDQFDV